MNEERNQWGPTERESPVGEPVIRGDPAVTGERADEAVEFDPSDPGSLSRAAETVRSFARSWKDNTDPMVTLRGAAACAALVRGVGSYKGAVERAGEGVAVPFVRKWARVHDLPPSIRRHVARGAIAPTAAKHIARVSGTDRLHLAWAILDHGLTVREVRTVASEVGDGATVRGALDGRGLTLGELTVQLPVPAYTELRQRCSLENKDPGTVLGTLIGTESSYNK
ncbi:MAG: hypothetical protein J07HX64_01517 [halophilic archaeon J07HX64]|nr:MAG: hypothetical protein J07HX64_01517 [halophilic archaeon J07HX64]